MRGADAAFVPAVTSQQTCLYGIATVPQHLSSCRAINWGVWSASPTEGTPMTAKPEDATWIGPWEDGRRLFDGQSWAVEHTTYDGRPYPITVAVIGKQYDDGRIQRR